MFQQIIVVAGAIFGVLISYFVVRYVIATVSPKTNERIELHFILKDIKRYFGFLFEMGYKIREAHYSMHPNGSWHVDIESKECVVSIVQDRSEILAYFSPAFGSIPSNDKVSIEAMIYFISEGRDIVEGYNGNLAWGKRKQFERLAGLLRTYIDQIAPYFTSAYHEYKDKLKEAERPYFNVRVTAIARQKAKSNSAQQSVHPTGGSRRVFKHFAWLGVDSCKMALSRPTHQRVTQAVGWHFVIRYPITIGYPSKADSKRRAI